MSTYYKYTAACAVAICCAYYNALIVIVWVFIFVLFFLQLVIERARTEKHLPPLDKTKFLVPEELTMSQLTAIIR